MDGLRDWILFGMSVSGFIGGGIFWYKASIEKSYASQRDFQHLRKNQEQIQQSASLIFDELNSIDQSVRGNHESSKDLEIQIAAVGRDMTETKALIVAMCTRLEAIANRGDGAGGGLFYRK